MPPMPPAVMKNVIRPMMSSCLAPRGAVISPVGSPARRAWRICQPTYEPMPPMAISTMAMFAGWIQCSRAESLPPRSSGTKKFSFRKPARSPFLSPIAPSTPGRPRPRPSPTPRVAPETPAQAPRSVDSLASEGSAEDLRPIAAARAWRRPADAPTAAARAPRARLPVVVAPEAAAEAAFGPAALVRLATCAAGRPRARGATKVNGSAPVAWGRAAARSSSIGE
mmetsp:Transcript_20907/g.62328  ORF Transcript_20907/g.62328 Transcript_20907/m.62328 type:complete len:224 (+) Transcript_20907:258-929(+)